MKCNNSGNKSQICDLLQEWDVPHRGNKSQICDLLQECHSPLFIVQIRSLIQK